MLTIEQMAEDIKGTWFGTDNDGYTSLCLGGESGELNELILDSFLSSHIGKLQNSIKKELRSKEFREDRTQEIDSEIPDIFFYLIELAMSRAKRANMEPEEYLKKIWNIKMFHNEVKYNRSVKRRPYTCNCQKCKSWKATQMVSEVNKILDDVEKKRS